jgi:hypothetical protein
LRGIALNPRASLMLLSEVPEFAAYPHVLRLVQDKLEMQVGDVRTMMLSSGCNFASVATLCNIVSGVSVSLFKPKRSKKIHKKKKEKLRSGDHFHRLLWNFYPWEPREKHYQKTKRIYSLVRNPLAHSLGEHDDPDDEITIQKTGLKQTGKPLTEVELDELERSATRPSWIPLGIDLRKGGWVMSAEGFYRGVFHMIWNLAKDAGQMRRAERRFEKGKILHDR